MRRLRAVLVDLYGTLVHDDGSALAAVCARVAQEGAGRATATGGVSAETVRISWDARLWELAEPAHGLAFRGLYDLTVSALADVLSGFGLPPSMSVDLCRPLRGSWRAPSLFADARPFLDAVRVAGLRVAMVSDADRADVDAVLARHGLTVDAIVTSEDVRAYKPRREPFLAALQALGVQPDEAAHVGDSWACDVEGAAGVGVAPVWLQRSGRPVPEMDAGVATAIGGEVRVAGDLAEAAELLRAR